MSYLLRGALALFLSSRFLATAQTDNDNASDPCAAAATQQAQALSDLTISSPSDMMLAVIGAETAFNCVAQLPLDADDAITVLTIIKEYMAFQTTLAYLKDPPEAYQQPAVDILGGLDRLADDVSRGEYERQYDFDLALRSLIAGAHEGHLSVSVGIVGLFTWRLLDSVVAISSDGQELPQVYAFSDVRDNVTDASPMVEIEGQNVFDYLESYANSSTSLGLIDPHADWNQIMWNGPSLFGRIGPDAKSATFVVPAFQATAVYNGPSVSGRFANGSEFEWSYVAGSLADLLDNGWDSAEALYEGAVLNQQESSGGSGSATKMTSTSTMIMRKESTRLPMHNDNDMEARLQPFTRVSDRSGLKARQSFEDQQPLPALRAVPFLGYPRNPDVVQEFFGVGGTVSGYILEDDSVGVLSIPSFQSQPTEVGSSISFSEAVAKFITRAKDAGVEKVVIDLSGNGGGTIFQGYDTAKRFFPALEPSIGFRTRASPQLNVIGSYLTAILDDGGATLDTDVFDETLTIFGTSIPFSSALSLTTDGDSWDSWSDFFGPRRLHGDGFTNTARYNLSSPAMARALGGQDIAGFGADNPLDYDEPPWAAEDVILLFDGTCGSTCTIFAELLKVDVGVRSVAVGGIPQYGPMQGVSGTRGSNVAALQSISDIAAQIRRTLSSLSDSDLNPSAADLFSDALRDISADDIDSLPTPLSSAPWRLGGTVNVLDEIRVGSAPDDPLQFVYQASDCRLFYTGDMIRDIRQLWLAAAKFAGGDDSVCVPGSTDGPGTGSDGVVLEGTEFSGGTVWSSANSTERPEGSEDSNGDDGDGDGDDGSGANALQASFGLIVAMAVLLLC